MRRFRQRPVQGKGNLGIDVGPERAFVGLAGFDDKGKYPDISRRVSELKREIENGNIALRSMRQRTLCDCLD